MSLFIQAAHANAAAPVPQQSPMSSLILIGGMLLIFYFLIWRPQMKRNKEHRDMIGGLSEGNEVVFAGGLMGSIKKIDGEYAVVSLNSSNQVTIQKASIISVLPTGTIAGLQ